MSELTCPLTDVAALKSHIETCPQCSGKSLVALAVDVLLAASSSEKLNHAAPGIIVINHHGHMPATPIPDSPTFSKFIETSFEPSYLRNMRAGGRKAYAFLLRRQILPALGDMRLLE